MSTCLSLWNSCTTNKKLPNLFFFSLLAYDHLDGLDEDDNIGWEDADNGEYDALGAGEVGARRNWQVVEGRVEKVQLCNDLAGRRGWG